MNIQWCQKMMDRVAALEQRVMELEAPSGPEIEGADVVITPEPKRRGRPPKTELN